MFLLNTIYKVFLLQLVRLRQRKWCCFMPPWWFIFRSDPHTKQLNTLEDLEYIEWIYWVVRVNCCYGTSLGESHAQVIPPPPPKKRLRRKNKELVFCLNASKTVLNCQKMKLNKHISLPQFLLPYMKTYYLNFKVLCYCSICSSALNVCFLYYKLH